MLADALQEALRPVVRDELRAALPDLRRLLVPSTPSPPKEWLNELEARDYLGWSKSTMSRRRDDGTLPYSKIGNTLHYRRADLLRVLEEHIVEPLAA